MFKITIHQNGFIIVDSLQLLMETKLSTARKIFKLEAQYSGMEEHLNNINSVNNAYEKVEIIANNNKKNKDKILNKANKIIAEFNKFV